MSRRGAAGKPAKALQAARSRKQAKTRAADAPEATASGAEAVKEPQPEALAVPVPLLLAADLISSKDDQRAWARTVFLHRKGHTVRVVGSDGHRMFIGSFKPPKEVTLPSWLEPGTLLSNEGLRVRLNALRQLENANVATISYVPEQPMAMLTASGERTSFRVDVAYSYTFPDYDHVLKEESFGGGLDEDGNVRGGEWQAVGFNSAYLRHVADVAKVLAAGLPKDERPYGLRVRAFQGSPEAPQVFDFAAWPGAILLVMPCHTKASAETAALLGPLAKGRVAALKAHATRWRQVADEAKRPEERAAAIAKADGFMLRIKAIQSGGAPAIEGGKQAHASEAEGEAASEPEAETPAEARASEEPSESGEQIAAPVEVNGIAEQPEAAEATTEAQAEREPAAVVHLSRRRRRVH